MRNVKWWI